MFWKHCPAPPIGSTPRVSPFSISRLIVFRQPDIVSVSVVRPGGAKKSRQSCPGSRRLLGHANITTTQRYMHLDDKELADEQDLVD